MTHPNLTPSRTPKHSFPFNWLLFSYSCYLQVRSLAWVYITSMTRVDCKHASTFLSRSTPLHSNQLHIHTHPPTQLNVHVHQQNNNQVVVLITLHQYFTGMKRKLHSSYDRTVRWILYIRVRLWGDCACMRVCLWGCV